MSTSQKVILACLGTAVVVVFACLGVYLVSYVMVPPLSQVPKQSEQSVQAEQSPLVTPTPYPTPTATAVRPTPTPRPPQYKLALLSTRGSSSYGFFTVEGEVKNISGSTLEDVVAVVTVLDSNHKFITYDEALIEYTTLLPGQISPFSVYIDDNPAIEW
jgi:hypothetical protein